MRRTTWDSLRQAGLLPFPNEPGRLEAVHLGHVDVHQDRTLDGTTGPRRPAGKRTFTCP